MPPAISDSNGKPAPPDLSPGRARFLALRRRRRRIRKLLIGALGFILLGGVVLWKPIYHRFRDWQNDRLVGEAKTAMEQSDWKTAFQRSATVLLSRSRDFESAWIAFESLRQLKSPTAVELGEWLLVQPQVTPVQKLTILEVMADEAPEAVFFRSRMSLPEEEREGPRCRALFARVLIRRGHYWYAELILRMSSGLNTDPKLFLELVRLLCIRGLDRDLREAWQVFRALKEGGHAAEALEALRLIVALERPEAIAGAEAGIPLWIRQQPGASASDWLIGMDVEIAQGRIKEQVAKDGVLSEIQKLDFQYSRDPAAVGQWLTRHGHPDEAIPHLTAPAAADPRAFAALAEAYIKAAELDPESKTSRLDAAMQLVRQPPPGTNPVELEMSRINVARARGDKPAEDAAWAAAVVAVDSIPSRNWGFDLAAWATRMDRKDQWITAMSAALRHRRGPLPTYRRAEIIIAALARQDRFQEILAICRNLVLHEPENPVLQNNLLYLQLLFGEMVPSALIPGMDKLRRNHPETTDFALSLGFAYLLNRQPEEAIRVLDAIPENPATPQRRALLGTAHRLLGRQETGMGLLKEIRWNDPRLLRKEVAILQDLLAPIDEAIAREKAAREANERAKSEPKGGSDGANLPENVQK